MYYYNNDLILQAYNVQCNTFASNIPAHYPDICQLLIDVNIYDIQYLVMFSRIIWCYFGLLLIWMEKICCCRCYRTLSLKQIFFINTITFIYTYLS